MNSAMRALLIHVLVLGATATTVYSVWSRDRSTPKVSFDTTVWQTKSTDLERVTFEGKKIKVDLTFREDALGRFASGTAAKEITKPAAKADPEEDLDLPPETETKTTRLLSVLAAKKLADGTGPLMAIRRVGAVEDSRLAEFGLAEPEGTASFVFKGTERKLLIGGTTPEGQDRYARDLTSNDVIAIKGDFIRDLLNADGSFVERQLHEWKEAEPTSARITADGKGRALARLDEAGKKFWADSQSPTIKDETLGNFMSKLERIRPTEYPAEPPPGATVVLRVDFEVPAKKGSFVELLRGEPGADGKREYYVRSEFTRDVAKVVSSAVEPLETDVASIVK